MTTDNSTAPVQGLTDAERAGLLSWVSACQSAYHIESTPGHRFGGLAGALEENREGLCEYVDELLAARAALAAAPAQGLTEAQIDALSRDLDIECERAMRQRDEFKRTGVSTAHHDGASHDTCFRFIITQHLRRAALAAAPHAAPVVQPVVPAGWQPIETAPKDGTPIIGWCVHDADPYYEEDGRKLTIYGAHTEGLGHVPDGAHVIVWGGAFDDSTWEEPGAFLPDWWFRDGSDFEQTANPTHWMPLPSAPASDTDSMQGSQPTGDAA